MAQTITVLGIDPGSRVTGFGLVTGGLKMPWKPTIFNMRPVHTVMWLPQHGGVCEASDVQMVYTDPPFLGEIGTGRYGYGEWFYGSDLDQLTALCGYDPNVELGLGVPEKGYRPASVARTIAA